MKPVTGRPRQRECRNCLHARTFLLPGGRVLADCRGGHWPGPLGLRQLEKPAEGEASGQGPACPDFLDAD